VLSIQREDDSQPHVQDSFSHGPHGSLSDDESYQQTNPDEDQSEDSSVDPSETYEVDEDEVKFATIRNEARAQPDTTSQPPHYSQYHRRKKIHGNDMQRERVQWDNHLEHIHQEEIKQLHNIQTHCQYDDCQSPSEYRCIDCNIGM